MDCEISNQCEEDMFDSTPAWTPKLRSSRRSTLYSSPRFLELIARAKKRKGSPYPKKGHTSHQERRLSQELGDPRRIKLTRLLGTGGFGAVYQGVVGGKAVAVKKLHAHAGKNAKARCQSFQAETRVLHLCHENIVSVLAAYCETEYDDSYIIMEYVSDVNLQRVLNEATKPLSLERRLSCALDVANALAYIHNHNVIHLDVKPANIMITPANVCKLADFGCCQIVDSEEYQPPSPSQRCYLTGTVAYRAPEVLRGEAPGYKADIYSYGITLWQMSTREIPFAGENQHVIIFGVVAQNLRPNLRKLESASDKYDPELIYSSSNPHEGDNEKTLSSLMEKCWDGDAASRPTARELGHILLQLITDFTGHDVNMNCRTPADNLKEWRRCSAAIAAPVTALFKYKLPDGQSPRNN